MIVLFMFFADHKLYIVDVDPPNTLISNKRPVIHTQLVLLTDIFNYFIVFVRLLECWGPSGESNSLSLQDCHCNFLLSDCSLDGKTIGAKNKLSFMSPLHKCLQEWPKT